MNSHIFRTGRTAACYNTLLQKVSRTALTQKVKQADARQARAGLRSRLDEVYDALDALQNHPLAYDDYLVRQTLSRVIAVSKHLIRLVFPGGLEVEQEVE